MVLVALIGPTSEAAASGRHAITRKQANRIALHVLRPAAVHEPRHHYIAVYGLPKALRAGSVVSQPTLGLIPNGGRAIRLRHAAWLFWENLDYDAQFVHPSVMLLVDARSGRAVARRNLELYPVVGGKLPPFLVLRHPIRYQIFSDVPKRLAAAADERTRVRASHAPRAHIAACTYDNAGFIGVADDRTPGWQGKQFATNATETQRTFAQNCIPGSVTDSRAGLEAALAQEESAGKNNITIFVTGHGSPELKAPNGVGGDYTGTLDGTVSLGPGGDDIDTTYLNRLMAAHPNTKFNFMIGSCFSGRFQPNQPFGLRGPNLGTVSTSSAPNETSYFNDNSPDKPDPFASASNMALQHAFDQDKTGDINKVLADAKAMEPSYDTEAKAGKTHPNSTVDYPIPHP
jgi:hypothetical protein